MRRRRDHAFSPPRLVSPFSFSQRLSVDRPDYVAYACGFEADAGVGQAAAGTNQRVKAVAELYGGVPSLVEKRISRLPATMILHGEDDKVVPVREAHAMAAFAKAKATSYVAKIYSGA